MFHAERIAFVEQHFGLPDGVHESRFLHDVPRHFGKNWTLNIQKPLES